jgi:hypothetical protein
MLHVGQRHGKPQHLSFRRHRLDQQCSAVGRGASLYLQHERKRGEGSLTILRTGLR